MRFINVITYSPTLIKITSNLKIISSFPGKGYVLGEDEIQSFIFRLINVNPVVSDQLKLKAMESKNMIIRELSW